METILDWAEKAGLENLKFRLQNAETLAKDASTTLTILLAGVAGSLAYAAKYLEPSTHSIPMATGSSAVSMWLMLLSFILMHFCIKTFPLQTPTNEPANLYQPEFTVEALREVELKNIQARIDLTAKRNASVAMWLDRTRYCAVLSPAIFAIAAYAASVR